MCDVRCECWTSFCSLFLVLMMFFSLVASVVRAACTSTRVVLIFSWTCTLLSALPFYSPPLCYQADLISQVIGYFTLLMTLAISRSKRDSSVWRANVHRYQWHDADKQVHSVPFSPAFFGRRAVPQIKVPTPPRRPAPLRQLSLKSNLATPAPAANGVTRPMRQVSVAAATLYAQHMHDYLPPPPAGPAPRAPEPPPLGNWPNANAINEPMRKKRREAPPAPPAVETTTSRSRMLTAPPPPAPPQQQRRTTPPRVVAASTMTTASRPGTQESVASSVASRGSGRKPSGDWRSRVVVPPPLDLSKISTNRSNVKR
jgi:hypothetical protein